MTTILVAEDEKDIRELIAFTLRYAGFDVLLAANGVEAVELAQANQPELIILDAVSYTQLTLPTIYSV